MKTIKQYNNKTKAAFVLLIVMLIILLNNFITLQNAKKTNENINTIYNDRLVVANYIFQYVSKLHYTKDNAQYKLDDSLKTIAITKALKNIQNLNNLYLKTVLTSKEKTSFEAFQDSCTSIEKETKKKHWQQVINSSNQALIMLHLLSEIQIQEGKSKLTSSNALYKNNTTYAELQIILLVVLGGICFYLLLIKKTKTNIKIPQPPSLN